MEAAAAEAGNEDGQDGGVRGLLAADVSLVSIREENVGLLKNLNAALFPIHYQQRFYARVLSSGDFSKLAFSGQTCIGSITCRIEQRFGSKSVNISTLGVLAPYRRLGVGSKLMKHVMGLCEQDQDIVDIYLHVQVNNDEAIMFYKKFGFEIRDTIRNYYKRIDPPDCYVLSKSFHTSSVLSDSNRFAPSEGQPV